MSRGPDLEPRLRALYARVPLGMRLGLDAMQAACARTGNPERAPRVIVHIGGTNGKGSTAAMVEAMARAAGKRTGLYTSPHLCRFAERIRLGGEPIGDEELAAALDRALEHDLSFFETATLAAFLFFAEEKVDVAVIEVGIGGRLDATNVVESTCAAITGVALDHQDRLGDTLAAIAGEKAAIARLDRPLVLGASAEEARAPALARGARVVDARLPDDVVVGLGGAHQRANAAVAWTVGAELGLAEAARRAGIATATWPGRFERIGDAILDGAHNPDGARALVRALAGVDVGAVIFGALEDKAWREMLGELAAIDAPRFYVMPKGRAAVAPARLASVARGEGCVSLLEALARARAVAGGKPVVVCGSLYLVGEARASLLGLAQDPVVAL